MIEIPLDMSQYQYLSVEMKGEAQGQTVYIGIKDKSQPDDGTETTVRTILSSDWETYTFNPGEFWGADLTKIHIPIEFVFPFNGEETVNFRNVQYLPYMQKDEG